VPLTINRAEALIDFYQIHQCHADDLRATVAAISAPAPAVVGEGAIENAFAQAKWAFDYYPGYTAAKLHKAVEAAAVVLLASAPAAARQDEAAASLGNAVTREVASRQVLALLASRDVEINRDDADLVVRAVEKAFESARRPVVSAVDHEEPK
jgi:hypothetical protein